MTAESFRHPTIPLAHGSGAIPTVGFGTLIPDLHDTKRATKAALEVGFRHLDCAERYRNEEAVGDALREAVDAGTLQRILPDDAMREIRDHITASVRFNSVVSSGVPGFIPSVQKT
jgi:diketogulonate reductase-like aldo/keto reductase